MNYFDDANSKHFSFESFADGLDDLTFGVINFSGTEAISQSYDFEIMLVSANKEIDLEDVLQAQAVFTIHRGDDDDVLYNGILSEFEQLHEVNDVIFYRARLVPKVWWLNLTHHNQVFLDQSVPDIVEDALRDGGLESSDFDISALSGYEELSYTCQYDESHFNFVSRNMERQGIYYYFIQEADGEVMVMTDTRFSHEGLREGADLFYNPASGLEGHHLGEAIGTFSCKQKQLPAEIILKDYNYEKPSLDITSRADVDEAGRGVSYLYGEYFATPEEGERFAGIRAEELLCQKQVFHGESTVPYMMPGFTFNLNNHYRDDFNQEYLVIEVKHEGNQSHLMSAGIASDSDRTQNHSIYKNSFAVIPNETQYRPQRTTKKPKISGTIHAKVDSEVEGEYAQLDEQGRYRVKLPFDINDDHIAGKGSAAVRMMQSYAGQDRGMQFPLVQGTEVLLTFIEGNPDRPVIAGAVSNPETKGPVNAENMSESVIQTGGSNRLRMEDKLGSQRMVLETPIANSWIRMGAHNDPIEMAGDAVVHIASGDTDWEDPGAVAQSTVSSSSVNAQGHTTQQSTDIETPLDPVIKDVLGNTVDSIEDMVATDGVYSLIYTSSNANTSTDDVAIRTAIVGDTTENIVGDTSGIRLHSAGDMWHEAKNRYAKYVGNAPDAAIKSRNLEDDEPNQIGDMLGNFGDGYNPGNLLKHTAESDGTHSTISLTDAMNAGEVSVSSMDTFTTQEGNIYDFGGYWNYNLGNSYEENFMAQSGIDLNDDDLRFDLMNKGGPHWSSINWPTETPDSNNQDSYTSGGDGGVTIDNDLVESDTKLKGTFNNGSSSDNQLWVSKSIGNAYEYTDGDSISVTIGSSLEVNHGGRHVEVNYRGPDKDDPTQRGSLASWSKSESGESWEKKWTSAGTLIAESYSKGTDNFFRDEERTFDRNTGDVCTYNTSQGTGMNKATFEFNYANETKAAFNFGMDISSEISANLKVSNETYLAGLVALNTYVGMKTELNFCAGMMFELNNDEYELKFPGLNIDGKTNKIALSATEIESVQAMLKQQSAGVGSSGANVDSPIVDLKA